MLVTRCLQLFAVASESQACFAPKHRLGIRAEMVRADLGEVPRGGRRIRAFFARKAARLFSWLRAARASRSVMVVSIVVQGIPCV
jgi:hypothetical protein